MVPYTLARLAVEAGVCLAVAPVEPDELPEQPVVEPVVCRVRIVAPHHADPVG